MAEHTCKKRQGQRQGERKREKQRKVVYLTLTADLLMATVEAGGERDLTTQNSSSSENIFHE